MKKISIKDLESCFNKVLKEVYEKSERYLVCIQNDPKIVIMSVDEYQGLLETIEIVSDKTLMRNIRDGEKEIVNGKGKTLEKLMEEWGIENIN